MADFGITPEIKSFSILKICHFWSFFSCKYINASDLLLQHINALLIKTVLNFMQRFFSIPFI